MNERDHAYKIELEAITGKLYKGDMTVMLYHLLKNTQDMDSLLEYLTGVCSESNSDSTEEIHVAPNFSDWFKTCAEIR